MVLAKIISNDPLVGMLALVGFLALWIAALFFVRRLSGWQILAETYGDSSLIPDDYEHHRIGISASKWSHCTLPCSVKLDPKLKQLSFVPILIFGSKLLYQPLTIPLNRLRPEKSSMGIVQFLVETEHSDRIIALTFSHDFTEQISAAIAEASVNTEA